MAEYFLERPDLGEEHVAVSATSLAVGSDVVGPKEPAYELPGIQGEFLEGEQESGVRFQVLRGFLVHGDRDLLKFSAVEIVGKPLRGDAEIVLDLGSETDFLEGGDLLVSARALDTDFRWLVGIDDDFQARGYTVGSAGGVGQFQFPLPCFRQDHRRQFGEWFVGKNL